MARVRRSGPIYRHPRSLIGVSRRTCGRVTRCISNEPPAPPCAAVNEPGMTVANTISPRARALALALTLSPYPSPRLVRPRPHPHIPSPAFPTSLFMGMPPHSLKHCVQPHLPLSFWISDLDLDTCMPCVAFGRGRPVVPSRALYNGLAYPHLCCISLTLAVLKHACPHLRLSISPPFALCRAQRQGKLGQCKRISRVP